MPPIIPPSPPPVSPPLPSPASAFQEWGQPGAASCLLCLCSCCPPAGGPLPSLCSWPAPVYSFSGTQLSPPGSLVRPFKWSWAPHFPTAQFAPATLVCQDLHKQWIRLRDQGFRQWVFFSYCV